MIVGFYYDVGIMFNRFQLKPIININFVDAHI